MKRKITFLIAALMLLTMINLPGKAVGQTFKRISSNILSDGDEIIFVKQTEDYACSTTQNSNNRSSVAITTSDHLFTKTDNDGVQVFTVKTNVISNETKYGFHTGSGYIYSNGNDTKLKTNNTAATTAPTGNYAWTVTVSNNVFQCLNVTNTSRFLAFNHSGTNKLFSQYADATTYTQPYIYERAYTVTYNAGGGSGTMTDTDSPYASGETVTLMSNTFTKANYEFSEWLVKDASNNELTVTNNTFEMPRSNVTVTALWNLVSSSPTISTSTSSLVDFSCVQSSGNPSESQYFTVSGANLEGNITFTLNENSDFAISSDNSTFGSSITPLSPTNGTVGETPIYVRLKASVASGNKSGSITVASSNATTQTINLSGRVIPVHTLTISATNGVIKNGDDTMATGTVAEGAEIEVTAVPNTGYKFTGWTVTGTGSSIGSDTDNPTTFTMGTADATLTAAFEVDPIVKTYLTGDDLESVTNPGTSYGNDYMKSVTTSDGFYWESNGYQQANPAITNMIQLRKRDHGGGVSYIKLPEFNGKIESIVFSVTDADNSSTTYADGGACKATVCFQTGTTNNETPVTSAGNTSSGVKSITLDLSNKYYSTGYITLGSNSAGARFWNIEVNYIPYTNFTEWTPGNSFAAGGTYAVTTNINTSENITIPATAGLVVLSDNTLTVTGTLTNNGTAANLIIEDGGQLILAKTNTGVAATVKKDVSAATAASKTDATYWYAISAGVANPSIEDNTNLITEASAPYHYDLYRFNETKNAGNAWENYRNSDYSATFTTLEKGRGYLYRNASDLTITMTGDINVEDFTYDVTKTDDGEYAGFNLIGNPYTHDIYKGAGTAITDGTSNLSTGFYYLEPSTGKWAKGTDKSTPIAPNQGILVQVNTTGNINMTNTNSNGSAKSNNDYIMLSVANSQYSDEAYAWFDKGIGLNKIEHRNSEIPMLYINQNGENFAIATMSDETQSFNLNFKAATMGKYTLSYETKGEYSYLHVIDRLTGEDVDMLMDGEYSFIASPIDSENRFIVCLEYSAGSEISESSVFAYQSGNDIIVNGEGELQIFDMMGRRVSTQYVSGVETINLQSHGVYIFKLNEKTQKIVVK